MEFTRQQLKEFNLKGYTSVTARYARDAEKMIEEKEQINTELLEALIWCSKKLNKIDDIGLDDIDNRMKRAIKKAKS